MKRSNKVLLGGFLAPIVIYLGFIIFMGFNGTKDPEFQMLRYMDGEKSFIFSDEWE